MIESTNTTCIHPRLITLPKLPGYVYGIICASCMKRLTIGYGYFTGGSDKKEFCLAMLIEETFGKAWGQKAEEQCRCTECNQKRTLEQLAKVVPRD